MNPYAAPVEDSDTPVETPKTQTFLRPLQFILNALIWPPLLFLSLYFFALLLATPRDAYNGMTAWQVTCEMSVLIAKTFGWIAIVAAQVTWTQALYEEAEE